MTYFMAGILTVLIALVVYLLLTIKPDITAGTYIESADTDIGKVKQRGNNNEQLIPIKPPESLVEWIRQKRQNKN